MSNGGTVRGLLDRKLTAKLFPGDYARLAVISGETGVSLAFLVRKAVRLYLDTRR